MPVTLTWLVPQRITQTVLYGSITREDLQAYDALMLNHLHGATALVHNIIDVRGITTQGHLRDVLQLQSLRHPLGGWGITLGAINDPITRMLTGMVTSVTRTRYRDLPTLAAALHFLCEVDSSLPPLHEIEQQLPAAFNG
ncbi:MAG: hypothetical protein MUE40_03050 [Anaerolineae bacterium]|nr:hypothetical protein [Anaerolineae bacterium]